MFTGPPGTYEICEPCGWEDDHVQLLNPTLRGGANKTSLVEAQSLALKKHPLIEQTSGELLRDPLWRPLDKRDPLNEAGIPRSGPEYFRAAGGDAPRTTGERPASKAAPPTAEAQKW